MMPVNLTQLYEWNKTKKAFDDKAFTTPHTYIIDKKQSNIFSLTTNKIYYREMPFDFIYIDDFLQIPSYSKEHVEARLMGLFIGKDKNRAVGYGSDIRFVKAITITGIIFLVKDNIINSEKYIHYQMSIFDDSESKTGSIKVEDNAGKNRFEDIDTLLWRDIYTYVCNFLDFLNHPEIEIITIERSEEQNNKRVLRGKQPIPTIHSIKCTGKLKEYLDSDLKVDFKGYSHMFDVRGHYIHFRNKDRYKRIYGLGDDYIKKLGYQKDLNGMISKWIAPFRKGKGIYIKKDYEVKHTL